MTSSCAIKFICITNMPFPHTLCMSPYRLDYFIIHSCISLKWILRTSRNTCPLLYSLLHLNISFRLCFRQSFDLPHNGAWLSIVLYAALHTRFLPQGVATHSRSFISMHHKRHKDYFHYSLLNSVPNLLRNCYSCQVKSEFLEPIMLRLYRFRINSLYCYKVQTISQTCIAITLYKPHSASGSLEPYSTPFYLKYFF